MAADGEILGATPARPSPVPDYSDDLRQPVAASPVPGSATLGGAGR